MRPTFPTKAGAGTNDWRDVAGLEIDWEELPHRDLGEFLDDGLVSPPAGRTPLTLLCLAQGLGRWRDVLRLLRDHPEELPARGFAPLKCLAYREFRRWLPAIRAAKAGGIRNDRYPGAKWASPGSESGELEETAMAWGGR